MNINIAVLEDIPKHYKQLAEVIHNWAEKKEYAVSVKWFHDETSILGSAFMKDCNLLFSDIELKNADTNIPADDHIKNGIDICTQLRKNGYQGDIIFLTAFREYVFYGYQAQAINYLLKPVSPEAIERCLDQYISLHSSDYYCLHKDNNITRIPFNDIISISRLGHDCCITTASGLYTERTSLKNMEQHLPEPFIRCHKSCIVNINHVTSLSGSTIYLANKQTQTVGRNYLDDVRKALLRIAQ